MKRNENTKPVLLREGETKFANVAGNMVKFE